MTGLRKMTRESRCSKSVKDSRLPSKLSLLPPAYAHPNPRVEYSLGFRSASLPALLLRTARARISAAPVPSCTCKLNMQRTAGSLDTRRTACSAELIVMVVFESGSRGSRIKPECRAARCPSSCLAVEYAFFSFYVFAQGQLAGVGYSIQDKKTNLAHALREVHNNYHLGLTRGERRKRILARHPAHPVTPLQ
ncbi:unnamed protein product [Hapterophycus canaliculatus]